VPINSKPQMMRLPTKLKANCSDFENIAARRISAPWLAFLSPHFRWHCPHSRTNPATLARLDNADIRHRGRKYESFDENADFAPMPFHFAPPHQFCEKALVAHLV
tara:strand:+ start:138 stop:452 length:315 start_codon:yes stop_codon:yes gene_type:complete